MHASVFLLRALYAYMRDEGLATEQLLSRTGLCQPGQGPMPIDSATLGTAIEVALESGAGPALALQVGAATPLQALGIFGEVIAQAPTLRSAVATAQHFLPLLEAGGSIRVTESGQFTTLRYEPAFSRGPERRFAIELALALMVSVARRFVGKSARPRRVLVPYDPPEYRAEYEWLFRCPVVFEAESAALIFDTSMLDVPQAFADNQLREILERQLECQLRSEDRNAPLHVRVRAILERDGDILAERGFRDLSRKLGVSRRVLKRKLSAEGQTLTGLLEDFRKQQAMYLLGETDIPLKNMAEKLGFSEQSAFYRAFKRWTGMTPLQYRRGQQQGAAGVDAA